MSLASKKSEASYSRHEKRVGSKTKRARIASKAYNKAARSASRRALAAYKA